MGTHTYIQISMKRDYVKTEMRSILKNVFSPIFLRKLLFAYILPFKDYKAGLPTSDY